MPSSADRVTILYPIKRGLKAQQNKLDIRYDDLVTILYPIKRGLKEIALCEVYRSVRTPPSYNPLPD